jgi:hypothetical protein
MTATKQEEVWIYAGRRWGRDKKIAFCWIDGDGNEYLYGKVKGAVLGGFHNITVERDGESVRLYHGVKFTGDRADDERVAVLQAQDRDAYNQQQQAATIRRLNASGPLDKAMEDIEEVARSCKNYDEIKALVAVTQERLYNAWDKRN